MKRPKKRHSFFRRLIVPLLIEAVVAVEQLEPGMVLTKDLVSQEGVLLLAADHAMTPQMIQRIAEYERRRGLNLRLKVRVPRR